MHSQAMLDQAPPRVIKFLHPGIEWPISHTPVGRLLPWNDGPHRRKYFKWPGRYLEKVGGAVTPDSLQFWAEWEAASEVLTNFRKQTPRALHRPIQTKKPPWQRSNTDPMVFGKRMYYSNCQQLRKTGPTQLHDLPDGSLILFGSCSGGKFLLDTVLVTRKVACYRQSAEDWARAQKDFANNPGFLEVTLRQLFDPELDKAPAVERDGCGTACPKTTERGCPPSEDHKFCIYEGVPYKERHNYDGCFSFVPARLGNEGNFNRIPLSLPRIEDSHAQGFCVVDQDRKQVFEIVLNALKKAGCGMAVELDEVYSVRR